MFRNSTGSCACSHAALYHFNKNMGGQMWQVNALLIVNAILGGVMVGIGAYGHRYRHHPLTQSLFVGATALVIPIVSNVVSTDNIEYHKIIGILYEEEETIIIGICFQHLHLILVFLWTALVQIVGISTTAVVATDAREGRNTGLSVLLLVEAIWTAYLSVYTMGKQSGSSFSWQEFLEHMNINGGLLLFSPFALIFAKLVFQFYAFYSARRSFALGRNPRLIVGYIEQLQCGSQRANVEPIGEHLPPQLVVMGEETVQVDKQPHGYCFRWSNNGLVTIDKVWQLDDDLLRSIPPKDVCFSFALFKLLRCRFAKYTAAVVKFTKVHNLFWQVLLKDSDDERVFGVIADELSFLHDYYYSSLPVSYSTCWLPILSIFISLLSIAYCLVVTTLVIFLTYISYSYRQFAQIRCVVQCGCVHVEEYSERGVPFGNLMFDLVPISLLLVLVVLAEAREIASYICSNWTKVSLICRYVKNTSWRESPTIRKWINHVLHCRCKLFMPWKDKMNQCSILELHPRKAAMSLLRRLISLPEQKCVKVPREVKAAIIGTLRSCEGCLRNNLTSLCLSTQMGDNLLWACNGKGTTETLLVWHIATGIFEVRHPNSSASDHKIVATHLSRYCAYLVAYSPELLPDDDEWSKILYEAVKKDVKCVLAGRVAMSTPEEEYQQLVKQLSARSKHDVLKNGTRLGKQLVDEMDEETAWKFLAGFWSGTILYVAPSDNLDGHAEAIARGGELITLLWALLTHIGIVSRPDATVAANACLIRLLFKCAIC